MFRVKKEITYKVADDPVTLSVIIGQAQLGRSVVKLEGELIRRGIDIRQAEIAPGSELLGKILTIKSVVTDVNDKTNRLSVRYELAGGQEPLTEDVETIVELEGDSAIFRMTITFE
ncbi:MAG: hypothetical protein JSW51_05275 [Gemmatimonadota bacterium]|nr:MAG: hypothetical protein JSW51_05275 [Gemmatimonadota bacterium]